MLTNRHIVVALLVAPVLAVLGWFAVGQLIGERAAPAQAGQSYPLLAQSNCRYASGSCELKNAELWLRLEAESGESPRLMLTASHPLDGVKLALSATTGVETDATTGAQTDAQTDTSTDASMAERVTERMAERIAERMVEQTNGQAAGTHAIASPRALAPHGDDGRTWVLPLSRDLPADAQLQLVARAAGAFYFAETGTAFAGLRERDLRR